MCGFTRTPAPLQIFMIVARLKTDTKTILLLSNYHYITSSLYGGLVVSVQNCQSRDSGFKSRPGQKFCSRFLLHLRPLANSVMMSTLTTHCQWEDETVRERTGHPPSYRG